MDELIEGDEGEIILDKTPFYGESGGQVGDTGTITSENLSIAVLDTKKINQDTIIHNVKVLKGTIKKGSKVVCSVDINRRKDIMRNHTATHLLHKTLRLVLGEHVKQSGSIVLPDRLRFDFTHFTSMTDEEIKKTEEIVNEKILENLIVKTEILNIEEAIKTGATALFDEKYGEKVRVVSIENFSKELCGGTHCKATGEIGLFVVYSEGSVASGIRRIEALTGKNAFNYLRQKSYEILDIKRLLKTETPVDKITKLIDEIKTLEKEIKRLKTGASADLVTEAIKDALEINGIKIVKMRRDGLGYNELRMLADKIRDRIKSGIIIVTSVNNSQGAIVCMVTKDLREKYNAGKIVKTISEIAGGKGGGNPEMAQGGTKDIEKLSAVFESLHEVVKKVIN